MDTEVAELEDTLVPIWLMLTKAQRQVDSNSVQNHLILWHSFKLLPMLTKIHQQLSSLSGLKSLRTFTSRFG